MKRPILTLALASLPSLSLAHTVIVDPVATAGRSFKAVFGIPHGCDGRPTTELHVRLPEGFVGAQPMPKPGWSPAVIEGDFAKSYDLHGKPVTRGPVEIRWTGGRLEDAWYDEFTVRGTFAGIDADISMAFPATQICEGGASVVWDEIAKAGEDPHALARPAPTVFVVAKAAAGAHGQAAAKPEGTKGTGQARLGDLEISGGFVRAMLPGAAVGGGYLRVRNGGAGPDRLLSVESARARTVELHDMVLEDDIMRMRPMPEGIDIPAGGSVTLEPGARHLMFNGVSEPFTEGGTVPLTLTFEKAGSVEVLMPVEGVAAKRPAEDHSGHAMPGISHQ